MRLTECERRIIRETAHEVFGQNIRIILFGSRTDDSMKGGDIDLLIEARDNVEQPALLSARLASRVSRQVAGRKVDVVLKAPNLQHHPIHELAIRNGILL